MVKTRHSAVYNSRIFHMLTWHSSSLRAARAALAVLVLACHGIAWAADWDSSERQLATKIVAITGTGPAVMELSNRSSLESGEGDAIRQGLISQLSSQGLKWASGGSASFTIQISLSENTQQYVWVAEVRSGSDGPRIAMVSMSRAHIAGPVRNTRAITLRRTLLWSSDAQIVDAIVINGSPERMVVLYPSQIQFYRQESGHWVEDQSFLVSHSRPLPRDLRGRLVLAKDHSIEALLPGTVCRSNVSGPLSVTCRETDDPWPVGTDQYSLNAFFAQSRNFFTGALSPAIGNQSAVPPFYSVAPIPAGQDTLWLLAGVDGRAHILDGTSDLIAGKLNWGSDVATIHSSCGSRWQILATNAGNHEQDAVQAYEVSGRDATAVGQAVSFAGGIASLWTAPDDSGAVAVTHNSRTGTYEAYLLTMACGQ